MGATIIAISLGVAAVAATGLVLTGIYYGVKCVVNIVREKLFTRVETSGKGNDMAKVAEGLNKDLKSHNIKRNQEEEIQLQKTINEIKNDTEHTYKISTKIERTDGEFIHTDDERDNLNEINVKFNKFYTHKDTKISINNFGSEFGDDFLNKFSKVGWENIIELNLSNNNIDSIEPLYKMSLINLEKMDLSNNNISDIDDIVQLQISNLKNINLENNKINDPFAFFDKKFEVLVYLNISNNNIEESDQEIFKKKYKKKNKNEDLILIL